MKSATWQIEGEKECLEISEHYRNIPFNEQAGRLWLFLHLEYSVDDVVYSKLMCIQNHAVADGESTKILFEQLLGSYQDQDYELPHIPFRAPFESFLPRVSLLSQLKALKSFARYLYLKKARNFLFHPPVSLGGATPRTRDVAFRLS